MRTLTKTNRAALLGISLCACLIAIPSASALAGSGGVNTGGGSGTVPGSKAKLKRNGQAVPPANAPARVKRAIRAANKIEDKPYRRGDGGHGSWGGKGYDCSGAVNYVLGKPGARVLKSPTMVSGDYARWGKRGKGKWITVYGDGEHVFAIIAGLRWDTSNPGADHGKGPSWSRDIGYGYSNVPRSAARHPRGL